MEEAKSTELTKIEGFQVRYDNPEYCRSYEELLDYAKCKGYKPGWAYYKAKERGYLAGDGA